MHKVHRRSADRAERLETDGGHVPAIRTVLAVGALGGQQGWGPNFVIPIRTTFFASDFGTPFTPGGRIPIRGNAFAGDRGVATVDVSTDGGSTWQAARIDYPGTNITWAFWTFDWQPSAPGDYLLVARAKNRQGQLQDSQYRDTAPQGATGYPGLHVRITN